MNLMKAVDKNNIFKNYLKQCIKQPAEVKCSDKKIGEERAKAHVKPLPQ